MAVEIVVETGQGLPNANAYAALATVTAYHAAQGNTAWTSVAQSPPSDLQLSAIIRATSYIDGRYGREFPGYKVNRRQQALQWPRREAYDRDGEAIDAGSVPIEIVNATCEAALREYQNPGGLLPDVVESTRVIREKVDVLEVQYANTSGADAVIPTVTVIDDILANLLGGNPSSTTSSDFFARA